MELTKSNYIPRLDEHFPDFVEDSDIVTVTGWAAGAGDDRDGVDVFHDLKTRDGVRQLYLANLDATGNDDMVVERTLRHTLLLGDILEIHATFFSIGGAEAGETVIELDSVAVATPCRLEVDHADGAISHHGVATGLSVPLGAETTIMIELVSAGSWTVSVDASAVTLTNVNLDDCDLVRFEQPAAVGNAVETIVRDMFSRELDDYTFKVTASPVDNAIWNADPPLLTNIVIEKAALPVKTEVTFNIPREDYATWRAVPGGVWQLIFYLDPAHGDKEDIVMTVAFPKTDAQARSVSTLVRLEERWQRRLDEILAYDHAASTTDDLVEEVGTSLDPIVSSAFATSYRRDVNERCRDVLDFARYLEKGLLVFDLITDLGDLSKWGRFDAPADVVDSGLRWSENNAGTLRLRRVTNWDRHFTAVQVLGGHHSAGQLNVFHDTDPGPPPDRTRVLSYRDPHVRNYDEAAQLAENLYDLFSDGLIIVELDVFNEPFPRVGRTIAFSWDDGEHDVSLDDFYLMKMECRPLSRFTRCWLVNRPVFTHDLERVQRMLDDEPGLNSLTYDTRAAETSAAGSAAGTYMSVETLNAIRCSPRGARVAKIAVRGVPPAAGDDEDDGYRVGDLWFDYTSTKFYVVKNVTGGSAVWTTIL